MYKLFRDFQTLNVQESSLHNSTTSIWHIMNLGLTISLTTTEILFHWKLLRLVWNGKFDPTVNLGSIGEIGGNILVDVLEDHIWWRVDEIGAVASDFTSGGVAVSSFVRHFKLTLGLFGKFQRFYRITWILTCYNLHVKLVLGFITKGFFH